MTIASLSSLISRLQTAINPSENDKARLEQAINSMLQASVDIQSIEGSIEDSLKRGIQLIQEILTLTLTRPGDAQIEAKIKELEALAASLNAKREELLSDQAQEFVGESNAQEILTELTGKISDDERNTLETQERDAENKCTTDQMTVPMLVLSIDLVTQAASILRAQQRVQTFERPPLPTAPLTVEQQVDSINSLCNLSNSSAGNAKQEMDKDKPLLQSALDQIQAIDNVIKADKESPADEQSLAEQFVNSTKQQFPLCAQKIVVSVAEAFIWSSTAQLRFDALKDKLEQAKLSDLETKVKDAADATQGALADASYTATMLSLMPHVARQLQQQLASAA